jgi:hypothetical protein
LLVFLAEVLFGRGEGVAGGGMVDEERREVGKVVRESRGSGCPPK